MLASMTGFGEARGQAAGLSVAVEVRTINNRHFKLSYRASRRLRQPRARSRSGRPPGDAPRHRAGESPRRSPGVGRGLPHQHVGPRELSLAARRDATAATAGRTASASKCCCSCPVSIDEQARADFEPRDDWPTIEPVLQEALAAVNKMRADEGKALLADLAANGHAVEQFLDEIAKRAPEVVRIVPDAARSSASTRRSPS